MKAKLIEIKEETKEVKTFILAPETKIDFEAGQFASFTIKINGKNESRIFTISSSPKEKNIAFTTIISESEYKQEINKMELNSNFEVSEPIGQLTISKSENKPLVFLAGGIGITPFKSMIEYLSKNDPSREVTLFYSNKTMDKIVFNEEFKKYSELMYNFKIIHIISRQKEVPIDYESGRINREIINRYLGEIANNKFYIVGPAGFVTAMKEITKEMYLLEKNVIIENFSGY